MKTEEIESLLRRARAPVLPEHWKHQMIPIPPRPFLPIWQQRAWPALASCWCLILIFYVTTPAVPRGMLPFDYTAYAMRSVLIERFVSSGQLQDDSPLEELPREGLQHQDCTPLNIESSFRLYPPHSVHPNKT